MEYNNKKILEGDLFSSNRNKNQLTRSIFWGEVIENDDPTDGFRIKIRIPSLDKKIPDNNLIWSSPFLSNFFYVIPQIGEAVRVLIEDVKYPQRNRYWMGSVISQPQKYPFDSIYTAFSTSDNGVGKPIEAPSKQPNAKGIYPKLTDVALVGRDNTDIILSNKEVTIRAGKHNIDDNLVLNKKNPAYVKLNFDLIEETNVVRSSSIIGGDKIALLTSINDENTINYKTANIDNNERNRIFETAHPLGKGDLIVQALDILRNAIIQHIHPYSGVPADPSKIVEELKKIDFNKILQKNIVIN